MRVEEFSSGSSIIHTLDPRAKLIATLVFSVSVSLNTDLTAAALAVCLPIGLILIASLSLRQVLIRLVAVNAFIACLWLVMPFSFGENAVYSFGPLHVYREGLLSALLITLKSNAIALMIIALLATSPIFNLVHALSHMGVPDKLVHLFFFCFRYVHVIHEEYHRLVKAMKIRGFKPGTNFHTYRAYAYLVGMLLVRSFDRSARIVAAMKCRGFKGRFYILHHYEMQRHDYMLTVSSMLFVAALLIAR
jgi:cobalt/nickel transport system permease protein